LLALYLVFFLLPFFFFPVGLLDTIATSNLQLSAISPYIISKEKPKRKGNISRHKSRMLAVAQDWKPITPPQLREAYFTKIEWAKKLIPKSKEEAEAR
jgi:hypothetical protein